MTTDDRKFLEEKRDKARDAYTKAKHEIRDCMSDLKSASGIGWW